ncbi:hypothetical protein EDB84DRAFT_1515552 [Lactarius hengduanensis]|nr:hypothetical protein EDB84DRAFT_1515552 [Lactarius hengduanensis]
MAYIVARTPAAINSEAEALTRYRIVTLTLSQSSTRTHLSPRKVQASVDGVPHRHPSSQDHIRSKVGIQLLLDPPTHTFTSFVSFRPALVHPQHVSYERCGSPHTRYLRSEVLLVWVTWPRTTMSSPKGLNTLSAAGAGKYPRQRVAMDGPQCSRSLVWHHMGNRTVLVVNARTDWTCDTSLPETMLESCSAIIESGTTSHRV